VEAVRFTSESKPTLAFSLRFIYPKNEDNNLLAIAVYNQADNPHVQKLYAGSEVVGKGYIFITP
jgi:hypothetical protein